MHTRFTSRFVAAVRRTAAGVRIAAAPRLLIDFTMHQVHTIGKECNYLPTI